MFSPNSPFGFSSSLAEIDVLHGRLGNAGRESVLSAGLRRPIPLFFGSSERRRKGAASPPEVCHRGGGIESEVFEHSLTHGRGYVRIEGLRGGKSCFPNDWRERNQTPAERKSVEHAPDHFAIGYGFDARGEISLVCGLSVPG